MKERKSSKTSRDNYIYLPPELMREVLARLPTKTLIKFRSVSETWLSLIDSSDFISLHFKYHNNNNNTNNNPQLLAWEKRKHVGFIFTLRASDTFKTIRNLGRVPFSCAFHGCCNGLILSYDDRTSELVLRNPSIGKAVVLPPVQSMNRFNYHYYYNLGFAPSNDDYKVLCFDCHRVAAIYSLNNDCWRIISDQVNVKHCGLLLLSGSYNTNPRVVSCGEVMYWTDSQADNLYSFNFDAEEFGLLQVPHFVRECIVWFPFRMGDSLAIFSISSKSRCIWVMEKDAGEDCWRLWFSGEPDSNLGNLLKMVRKYPLFSVVYLQKSNKFLISYQSSNRHRCSRNLISYDIKSQEIKRLGNTIRGKIFFATFVESLVFHKGFEERRLISFP